MVEIGKYKKKPSDWFTGEIKSHGVAASWMTGSYLSHIEIDGKNYWNYQTGKPFKLLFDSPPFLLSDHKLREDRKFFEMGNLDQAETASNNIEAQAKKDSKNRKEVSRKTLKASKDSKKKKK